MKTEREIILEAEIERLKIKHECEEATFKEALRKVVLNYEKKLRWQTN